MVGRALDGEVERDLQAVLAGRFDQSGEVVEVAELRVDGVVAAFGRPDRIGAAGIVGGGRQLLFRPLRLVRPIGWIGREIEHVEAEVADIGQLPDDVVEGAVTLRIVGHRARQQLVPGAEGGTLAVDDQLQLAWIAGEIGADAGALHESGGGGREEAGKALAFVFSRVEGGKELGERFPVAVVRAFAAGERAFDELAALGKLQRDRHARSVFLRDFVAPACKEVAPGDQGVAVARVRIDDAASPPAVIVEECHRRFAPSLFVASPDEQSGVDLVVAVTEDVGLDHKGVADRRLCRKAAAIDLRRDRLDRHAARCEREKRGVGLMLRIGGRLSRLGSVETRASTLSAGLPGLFLARGLIRPFVIASSLQGRLDASCSPR